MTRSLKSEENLYFWKHLLMLRFIHSAVEPFQPYRDGGKCDSMKEKQTRALPPQKSISVKLMILLEKDWFIYHRKERMK